MQTRELVHILDELLDSKSFKDASYNGLQVQAGTECGSVIATAPSATLDAIQQACDVGAKVLLVHHGLFWKGASPVLTGAMADRVKLALQHGLNIVAYHLPVDAHPILGNNAALCDLLCIDAQHRDFLEPGNKFSIGMTGTFDRPVLFDTLLAKVRKEYGSQCYVQGVAISSELQVSKVAVCSGEGGFMLDMYDDLGYDLLITGEVPERVSVMAAERGIPLLTVGHDASEQRGIERVAEHICTQYGLQHVKLGLHIY